MYAPAVSHAYDNDHVIRPQLAVVPAIITRIALVGGFTPRRCGIAMFTADIYASLRTASPTTAIDIYAMTPAQDQTVFDAAVRGAIIEGNAKSFVEAATEIEKSGADLVWLQHEFGLFGGSAGDMVLELVDRITVPLIVTMHTVIPDPDPDQMRVMRRLVARASKLIVMSKRGQALLSSVFGADKDQIVLIPHGVPDRPFGRSTKFKAKLGFEDVQLLMTFGLLSPGKGIETVIAALPAITADNPNVLYAIVGATHPNLIAREGEAYREKLKALAARLGVEHHVRWIDTFVETEDLLDLLEATDIYVTPYPGAAQSTSGTLSYAVALGKAVVSTPYVHATELLGDEHGVLVPFNDSGAIAREVGALLNDPDRLLALQKRAHDRGRDMIWPAFATQCLAVIHTTLIKPAIEAKFDAVGLEGLLRICDDTGILQHSIHNVPDRAHGYCVDDNARALMLVNRLGESVEPHRSRLATVFAAFVQSAWNADAAEFRNFMSYQRHWLEDNGSEDSCGRTIWALGATALEARTPALRHWARGLFDQTATSSLGFGSPRAIAFAVLGSDYMLRSDPEHEIAQAILRQGSASLHALLTQTRRPDWPWFETMLAYDNCRLPEALLRAGSTLDDGEMTACGLATLKWINMQQRAAAGHFRPVGSDSFGRNFDAPMPFDQQPVEIWAAIDAAAAAYDVTGGAIWIAQARCAYAWFSGKNDRGVPVADPMTGTCHDGINPRGLNLNEGAESVLSYQLATCALRNLLIKAEQS